MQAMSQALIAGSLTDVERVGVFVDATLATLTEAVKIGQLTTLQLHGEETPQACADIRHAYPNLKIIKAFRIRSEADLSSTSRYDGIVDALLLDAYHPQLLGGTGKTLPWQSLKGFQPGEPWILAGGLTPENVLEALAYLAESKLAQEISLWPKLNSFLQLYSVGQLRTGFPRARCLVQHPNARNPAPILRRATVDGESS